MSTNRKEIYVKCPFYNNDIGKKYMIDCEGIMSKHSQQVFPTHRIYSSVFRQMCCGQWEKCPYAIALKWAKYK